jgi:hypothetical protein
MMNSEDVEHRLVRTGQGSPKLAREEFEKRYEAQFYDPAFGAATLRAADKNCIGGLQGK